MLRQSPSRNQRSKGFKLKSVLQICVLLVICIWLLYQVKHFRNSMANKESTKETSEKVRSGHEIMRLGRKGLHPEVKEKFPENEIHGEGKEVPEEEEEEEEEESRAEGNGDDARGAADDDMDGRDQDRLEEEEEEEEEESDQAEDFVDDDDKDREEESER